MSTRKAQPSDECALCSENSNAGNNNGGEGGKEGTKVTHTHTLINWSSHMCIKPLEKRHRCVKPHHKSLFRLRVPFKGRHSGRGVYLYNIRLWYTAPWLLAVYTVPDDGSFKAQSKKSSTVYCFHGEKKYSEMSVCNIDSSICAACLQILPSSCMFVGSDASMDNAEVPLNNKIYQALDCGSLCLTKINRWMTFFYFIFLVPLVREGKRAVQPVLKTIFFALKHTKWNNILNVPKLNDGTFSKGYVNMHGHRSPSISASWNGHGNGHLCDGRQHNLRFNYDLKMVL